MTIFKSWHGVLTGAIATAGVLLAGLVSFKQGNFNRSQMFMRARVGFQAATVALMVGTVYVEGVGKSWFILSYVLDGGLPKADESWGCLQSGKYAGL